MTAMVEAMLLAGAREVGELTVAVRGAAPVGGYVEIEATPSGATATCDGKVVAECRA